MFKFNCKNTRTTPVTSFWCLYILLTSNIFLTFFWSFYCWLWTSKCQLDTYCKYFVHSCVITQKTIFAVVNGRINLQTNKIIRLFDCFVTSSTHFGSNCHYFYGNILLLKRKTVVIFFEFPQSSLKTFFTRFLLHDGISAALFLIC